MRSSPLLLLLLLPLAAGPAHAQCQAAPGGDPVVELQTSLGSICIQLLPDAPLFTETVANFLGYVNRGDYDGTFIHRSDPDFVIQGGGFRFRSGEYQRLCNGDCPTVDNEFEGMSSLLGCGTDPLPGCNVRGSVAMAQAGGDADSATSQWFVNLEDRNRGLDTARFTVFGHVVSGMAVVDAIAGLSRIDRDFALTVLQTPQRGAFGELPLTSPLPPSCFSLSDLALVLLPGQSACVSNNLEPDPVTGSFQFVSPVCFSEPASCPGPALLKNVCGAFWFQGQLFFDGLDSSPSSCEAREASNLARAALEDAVSTRLVEISRAFVVPEPGAMPSALAALAALGWIAQRRRSRCYSHEGD